MILTVTLNAAIDKRYVVNDFKIDEVNRTSQCEYAPGGKGLNVSRAATIMGVKNMATGYVGGHAGDFIAEEIEKQGVTTDFVKVAGESRSCINIFDAVNKTQTEFLEPGVTITEDDEKRFLENYDGLLKKADVIAVSGSVPKGVGTDFYPILVKKAHDAGKKIIVDTSGSLLTEVVKAKPNMIKPNTDEIKMITGKDINSSADLIEAGKELVGSGIEQVVISLGADGALLFRKEGVFKAVVPKIDAVNTVGCGDCMTAGFAIAFEKGLSPEESLRLASATSTAAAMTEATGFFRMEDFDKLKKEIKIEKL